MPNPERLVPKHIAGDTESLVGEGIDKTELQIPAIDQTSATAEEIAQKTEVQRQRYESRWEALDRAQDFEAILAEQLKSRGKNVPENLNLSLLAIQEFQRYVEEAQDLRKQVKVAENPQQKSLALRALAEKKKQIDEYYGFGASFERAYREYLRDQNRFSDFRLKRARIKRLEHLLDEPTFTAETPERSVNEAWEQELSTSGKRARQVRDKTTNIASESRLERLMHEMVENQERQDQEEQQQDLLESLKLIYPEGSEAYNEAVKELVQQDPDKLAPELPRSKAEIKEEVQRLQEGVRTLWEDPMVRYFYKLREFQDLMAAFARGEDVIETQSVIKHLNQLHEWEQQHQRTTIGGVLVGPPGVGKTTLVRHYLELKGRKYVYIDLSEDVTRYLLYGSKSIEFKSPLDYLKTLTGDLSSLDEQQFDKFVSENAEAIKNTFGATDDEAVVVVLNQIQEYLNSPQTQADVDAETAKGLAQRHKENLQVVQEKITELGQKSYRKQLASEFGHLVKRNGWRDGMVIAALRRGDSVLFDEFNKNKNWSLIYSLMTAKPGEKWYFADNDEQIAIPEHWRIYFTANIGKKHGVAVVSEALASRAGGKVMEVDYPGVREEMQVALTALANIHGDFLRSKQDLAKLFVLIHEVFTKVREFIADKPQSIPLSFRTIRDLGEKLVLYRDPKTKRHIYEPTKKSFDEAAFEVLVGSYPLYEDKTIPTEITNLATSLGLFLQEPNIKDKVVALIGEQTYKDRQEEFNKPENIKSYEQIANEIRGLADKYLMSADIADQTRSF
jgi:hypothetical protein